VSGKLHAPADLTSGKEPRYPLDRNLGGPQSRSGRCGEEKNFGVSGFELKSSYTYSILRSPCPFAILVKVHLREGKAVGSEKGDWLGCITAEFHLNNIYT
jgi:hypothetical protein